MKSEELLEIIEEYSGKVKVLIKTHMWIKGGLIYSSFAVQEFCKKGTKVSNFHGTQH